MQESHGSFDVVYEEAERLWIVAVGMEDVPGVWESLVVRVGGEGKEEGFFRSDGGGGSRAACELDEVLPAVLVDGGGEGSEGEGNQALHGDKDLMVLKL